MGRIYTFVNQKGGVGKTTSAINLAAYLGRFGLRVLIIDLDPQANATSCLNIDRHIIQGGTYQVLIGASPPEAFVLYNPRLKLSILPANAELAGAEIELVSEIARESKLRSAIRSLIEKYDYILIDCPPSLGLLTLNGIVAAKDGLIIPVQCEYLALEGLGRLMDTIRRVRSALFPELTIRGVLLTMFDSRTNLSNEVVAEVKRFFPNNVFQTIIPRSVRLAEAPSFGKPIVLYAPQSSGALAYEAFTQELLQGDGVFIPTPIQQS
ncbi:MAG: ParA family protein [Anaerolineales bacterium]|nr:ParA family protein [Anaerolineales bacterium]MDW8161952.1 ParA family protein [Anaerolineales bacterium]